MAAFVLSIDVAGDVQVLSALSRFGEYATDMRDAFDKIADDFQKNVSPERFAKEGPGWAPLSPAYARWKAREYPGKKILERTGDLKSSLEGGPGAIRIVTKDALVLGTSIPYARYHQSGTSRMPQREVVRIGQFDRIQWAKIVQAHLVAAAKKAKLEVKAAS